MKVIAFCIAGTILFISGCGPIGSANKGLSASLNQQSSGPSQGDLNIPSDGSGNSPTPDPTPPPTWEGLKICSPLSFTGLSWSKSIGFTERDPLALALNISGSFEGASGWANLANNFDGMGLSMGLLNQNFGQGTLQPIWSEMRKVDLTQVTGSFSSKNFSSLSKMLDLWESKTSQAKSIHLEDYGYNDLDDPELVAEDLGVDPLELQMITTALLAKNQESVNWAKQNLYSGTKFKSDWKSQLTQFANTAAYRSIQVSRAEKIHNQALELMATFQAITLKSYLFFFDIVVQNGGISTKIRDKYLAWAKSNGAASEKTRMLKLLEYRLTVVNSKYVSDVRSRKTAILNGKGVVHGASRDFAKEYCADLSGQL